MHKPANILCKLAGSLSAFSALSFPSLAAAQQYCVSGIIVGGSGPGFNAGDSVSITARITPGKVSCLAGMPFCTAEVHTDIQSGARRWSDAPSHGQVHFVAHPENNTTSMMLTAGGALTSISSNSGLDNTMSVLFGASFPGNLISGGALPSSLPVPLATQANNNSTFQFVLMTSRGNVSLSYTGQGCAGACPTIPSPGDVVAYFDADDTGLQKPPKHVAVITKGGVTVNADGSATVTKIISKWGDWGVYESDPDDTTYGTNWAVFHTNRAQGNTLIFEDGHFFTDRHREIYTIQPNTKNPLTQSQINQEMDQRCPGLSHVVTDEHWPSVKWIWVDCRGYVFASGTTRIQATHYDSFGLVQLDQVHRIFEDNGYCRVPAHHTGGHGCSVLNSQVPNNSPMVAGGFCPVKSGTNGLCADGKSGTSRAMGF